MKLWHDDIRTPPDNSWEWARTNEQAQEFLKTGDVKVCSLDHDLGLDSVEIDPNVNPWRYYEQAGDSPYGTGVDLVEWMVENHLVPDQITIHSWNPEGAIRMAKTFNDAGYDCMIAPFRP